MLNPGSNDTQGSRDPVSKPPLTKRVSVVQAVGVGAIGALLVVVDDAESGVLVVTASVDEAAVVVLVTENVG